MSTPSHISVMPDEAVSLLNIRPGHTYIDATAGGGGHLQKILDLTNNSGKVIGIDRDPKVVDSLTKKFSDKNVKIIQENFSHLKETLSAIGIDAIDGGIIADLGISSLQLDDPTRGFSFLNDGPLDMRMDLNQSLTAADLVNTLSEKELADIIFKYGDERFSRAIAKRIVAARPLSRTGQLSDIVSAVVKRKSESHFKHPATRTFQALRIAVNAELESLEILLNQARELLLPGARLAIITFHSLEDRLVKHFFREMASSCICPPKQPICTCNKKPEFLIITRKPIVANEKEVLANIRSRSAKLRAAEKLP